MSDMVYKLYAQSSANANDAAHVDIVDPGYLESIDGVCWGTGVTVANGTGGIAELSFSSAAFVTTNDVKSSLMILPWFLVFSTSGTILGVTRNNVTIPPRGIPVARGDRIYLHFASFAGTLTLNAVFYLSVEVGRSGMPSGMLRSRR